MLVATGTAMEFNRQWTIARVVLLLVMSSWYILVVEEAVAAALKVCPEAVFAFGASMTDTGNSQAAFPFQSTAQSSPPYGQTFFHRPANRYSDGRLVVDFFAQALKIPLLSPQLESVGPSDFTHGANFAFSGVTTANNSFSEAVSPPFYFWMQTKQFQYFKQRTLSLWKDAKRGVVVRSSLKGTTKPQYFQTALYFTTFGTNDFVVPLFALNQTIQQVQSNISSISDAMLANTEELYKHGARAFMVFNIPPLGCYPLFLATPRIRSMSALDAHGCLASLNAAIHATNSLIRTGLQGLRVKYPDATILYADLYHVLETLIWNGTEHGGGQYNLQPGVHCGASAIVNGVLLQGKSCSDPKSYVNWDGLHLTEAAARVVALTFLHGKHLEPPSYQLSKLCKLSYEQFY